MPLPRNRNALKAESLRVKMRDDMVKNEMNGDGL
jgi:hypothetical protein